jgi:hypothetical protein
MSQPLFLTAKDLQEYRNARRLPENFRLKSLPGRRLLRAGYRIHPQDCLSIVREQLRTDKAYRDAVETLLPSVFHFQEDKRALQTLCLLQAKKLQFGGPQRGLHMEEYTWASSEVEDACIVASSSCVVGIRVKDEDGLRLEKPRRITSVLVNVSGWEKGWFLTGDLKPFILPCPETEEVSSDS